MSTPVRSVKWYRKLATRKGRLEAGAFIVEGDRAIRQIMAGQPGEIMEILSIEEPLSLYRDYAVRQLTESQFLSICQTRTPQGILAVVKLPLEVYSDSLPDNPGNKVLILEDIQDPGNMGTLIRTAAAFDFSGVIMTEKCADPLAPKCVQATAGTVLSVWLRRTGGYLDLTRTLRNAGYFLVATDIGGTPDPSVLCHQQKLALALGNEAAGMSGELLEIADYRLRIPISQDVESLNVAACGAICMYLSSKTL
ncbi:MAG: RNA methyltransferase [Dehalococcoidales bacterium]|nr:RNA methyltransferase [Dehalococcoidales bacterium]